MMNGPCECRRNIGYHVFSFLFLLLIEPESVSGEPVAVHSALADNPKVNSQISALLNREI